MIMFLLLAVLENVVFEEHTREVDYADKSVTGKYQFFEVKIILDGIAFK